MKHGSLFSGIGGFDLAAEWMGWENIFHCELNDFGQKVLKYYWPEAETFTDITKSDFTKYANRIDILTGGFPCQPYSQAGKRLGKEDDRHLWPEMLRAIREIQPCWVVGENVRGHTNWNEGMVFDEVQTDLGTEGYEVTPFLLPACAVNAPHRRDRIWFIAKNTNEDGWGSNEWKEESSIGQLRNISTGNNEWLQANYGKIKYAAYTQHTGLQKSEQNKQSQQLFNAERSDSQIITDTTSNRLQGWCNSRELRIERQRGNERFKNMGVIQGTDWENFPTQPALCSRNDGVPTELSGITFSKHRNESIKAYGNAVVPQVPFQIFKAIEEYEKLQFTI